MDITAKEMRELTMQSTCFDDVVAEIKHRAEGGYYGARYAIPHREQQAISDRLVRAGFYVNTKTVEDVLWLHISWR